MANEQTQPPQRNGRAALVWLIIFILLGTLVLFRGFNPTRITEFDQTEFEAKLAAGDIKTAVVTSENERVLSIEGKYYTFALPAAKSAPEAENKKSEATPQPAAATAKHVVENAVSDELPKTEVALQPAAKPTGARTEAQYSTRVIYTEKLADLLSKTQLKVESGKDTWWALIISLLPVILILGAIYFFTARQMRAAGRGAMDFGKSRARMIPPDELHIKFDDIAGADEAKEEIREIVEFLRDPLRFQLVGGRIPKGCLLVGPPGTGKTLMAKAVACEAGVPFFSISGSDFVEMFVGVGASRVRDMFEQARKNTPSLLFIDEIDAVGRSRFSGWGGGHDEREQTLNAMLVEMDGLESRSGVIVLAATNRPDVLDPALLRPGRFDRQIVMDLPDIVGRRKILDVHAKNIKVDSTVDLDVIARTTPGFSGADLANLCNEAALLAARYNREAVTGKDMEEARDKVCYGRERRSRRIIERERRLTAYHEAGHALVAIHSPHATPVHKVTIIPRGQAYLGATFMMPKEDVYTHSRLEMLDEMAVSMGGRVAEELVFGDITTGAAGDIDHLTHMARAMACIYGMTDVLGPIRYSDMSAHPHVRIDSPPPDLFAPETMREIDLEIRKLVTGAHERARILLTAKRDELEKLAAALLEKETLSIDEINVLLNLNPPPPEITTDVVVAPDATAEKGCDDGHPENGNPL